MAVTTAYTKNLTVPDDDAPCGKAPSNAIRARTHPIKITTARSGQKRPQRMRRELTSAAKGADMARKDYE
jgi:hypothetical protein